MGRRDDLIITRLRKPLIEKRRPLPDHEFPIRSLAELAPCPAVGIVVYHEDRAIIGLAPRFGFCELRRVKRAVTATTDDDDVSQRINLPPSTTRIVPVT